MKHTELWAVMERVFPEGRARSLAQDLALPQLQLMTPNEALEAGVEPIVVWKSIVEEMGLPASYEYLHRMDTHS